MTGQFKNDHSTSKVLGHSSQTTNKSFNLFSASNEVMQLKQNTVEWTTNSTVQLHVVFIMTDYQGKQGNVPHVGLLDTAQVQCIEIQNLVPVE